MARPVVPSPRFDFRGGVNTAFSADVLDATELRRAENARPTKGGYQKLFSSLRLHGDPIAADSSATDDLFADGRYFSDGDPRATPYADGTVDLAEVTTVDGLALWDAPGGRQAVVIAGSQWWAFGVDSGLDLGAPAVWPAPANQVAPLFARYRTGTTEELLIADGALHLWDGTTLTDLTALGAPAATMVAVYKLRVFASDGTKTLYWSKIGDPTKWAPADGGGFADIETFDTDPLTGLVVVGGSLLLPKQDSIARFTGSDSTDIQIDTETEGVSNLVGNIGRRMIVPFAHGCLMLSRSGLIFVDESGVQEMGQKVSTLFANPDQDYSTAFAVHVPELNELWFWIADSPLWSNVLVPWVYNTEQQNWTGPFTACPATAAATASGLLLRASPTGYLVREQLTFSFFAAVEEVPAGGAGGQAIAMSIELPPLLFGAPGLVKSLRGRQTIEADLGQTGQLDVAWSSEMGTGVVSIATKGPGVRDYAYRLGAKGRRIVVTLSESTAEVAQINGLTPLAMVAQATEPRGAD